ncbi:1,4-alpha-glucan branching protein GlgB [Persicimonas caeni]|uniref:1,4-alpha-glucan branching enzyme GlgB n=1 Tax=Persicimonas caeni TaxID=2292766 RepID=A0A4Y6Q3Y6_PERCE|nr:1,4-alpha-glucan branching protein GlgB [Persicimonas caeni]QDG54695.1 1,4-alpha-glucan branching protein GlgB [Persicimonas caeni]QED35916.1 1,4-alpha-glucan branching protein GlgB [Persicimonas caeni]
MTTPTGEERPQPQEAHQPPAGDEPVRYDYTRLSDQDRYLFNEGTHFGLHNKLGSHTVEVDGELGTYFGVWAPDAERISVIGDFNGWNPDSHPLRQREATGLWEGFIPGVTSGTKYKYHIKSRYRGYEVEKADPFAFHHETPPKTASVVWELDYEWGDEAWMEHRQQANRAEAPTSIYEVHLGSWMRAPDDGDRFLSYRELAPKLADYVEEMGFTHVELMPVMEHPFYGSWGYQITGYFAPSSRYGTPQDFMYLVDHLHQRGIGVILDWVPSHFPGDEHGLAYFDGTSLFEHADERKGFHPDWKSYIFNYGRNEVRAFLASNAMYWLEKFHIDGLRVDAVASMLYLDYSRKPGEWVPNKYGGRENIEAVDFLRFFNEKVYERFPDVQTIAEESTAWPMVSRPTYTGGLGFGMKWDMGWMHDTLEYMSENPVHRKYYHNDLTFRGIYAFNENFVLPLSHDEVVHGKGSLLEKMPGDDWQQFANLRLLFAYMYAQPGKKLLFMGGEFGQRAEWNHDRSLDWHLLEHDSHEGVRRLVRDLNHAYRDEPALHRHDFEPNGFQWIDTHDTEQSVLSFLRWGDDPEDVVACVFNFTPVPRQNYRIGVPFKGTWSERINTDAQQYWGSGVGNWGEVEAAPIAYHGHAHSLMLTLPPLGALYLRPNEVS